MNIDEFLEKSAQDKSQQEEEIIDDEAADSSTESLTDNIDVQKAVVESLAADKAEMSDCISRQKDEIKSLKEEISKLNSQLIELRARNAESKAALEKVGDVLLINKETSESNMIALLDRSQDLDERFQGEMREHVLEVIREARDKAEQEGRLRRAQVLESVLVFNESSGVLQKKRLELEKFFNTNQNILSGPVINELDKMGITYKIGEKYLLVGEIIKRAF